MQDLFASKVKTYIQELMQTSLREKILYTLRVRAVPLQNLEAKGVGHCWVITMGDIWKGFDYCPLAYPLFVSEVSLHHVCDGSKVSAIFTCN